MNRKKVVIFIKVLLLILTLFLVTFRAIVFFGIRGVDCTTDWLLIIPPCNWINVFFELVLWTIAIFLLALVLIIDHEVEGFLQTCKHNWLIFVFVLLAFISLIWTIHFEITLYKAIVLLFTTLMAVYIGHSFRLDGILKILSLYYVFLSTLNLLFVLVFSPLGIMQDQFYKGAWQGIFWHRNYLGCFMAFGVALFLVNFLASKKNGGGDFYLNLVMLVITLFLLLKSKSATAIITMLVLVGLVFMLFIWVKWNQKFKPIHYYGFLGIATAGVILFFLKVDFFLGLLGRNSSLTGRIPLWKFLFQHLISWRPWLGYGYGAIWHMKGIRYGLAMILHWPVEVLIGDNGFIDILLHLGFVGLTILLLLIIFGFIRACKYFLQKKTLETAFPIIALVFVIIANISLSLILESESFVWMISLALVISISAKFPSNEKVV